jgi:hypothetical protein
VGGNRLPGDINAAVGLGQRQRRHMLHDDGCEETLLGCGVVRGGSVPGDKLVGQTKLLADGDMRMYACM